jgi:site-specific recombinase XerD
VVQTLLGHSTIAITAEFYANVTVEDVRSAMEATAASEPIALPDPKRKESDE